MTFKMFDKDGGGTISIDELKEVLAFGDDVDETTMEEIMKMIDGNDDAQISFNEFK
jgi:calcium-dependent protein kinase